MIDFIGNELVSRIVIKKGYFSLIYKNNNLGHIVYILDENQNILKGENTGIWIENKFYKSNLENGSIFIPFNPNLKYFFTVIVKHENFCELNGIDFNDINSYNLEGMFIFNRESILIGNNLKVLFRPFLYNNKIKVNDLSILKKPLIEVNLIKKENNQEIPIKYNFDVTDDISNKEEIEIEFPIPTNLISMEFNFKTEITNILNEKQNFNVMKSFKIEREYDFEPFLLINKDDEYIIQLLGKNGEIKKKCEINILFNRFLEKSYSQTFESDNEGKIYLGKLKEDNIKSIEISYNYIYLINSDKFNSIETIEILEGQEIILPIEKNDMIFLCSNFFEKNLTDKIKINSEDNEHFFINFGKDLLEGKYKLIINQNNIVINIYKGKKWENDFLVTDKFIIESNEKNSIKNFISKVEYKNNELLIKLNKKNNNVRLHLNANQFFPVFYDENLKYYSKLFISEINKGNDSKKFSLNNNFKNSYLNDKILNEEIQYVLDRKLISSKLGNSLEKPSLLLKPQKIKETETKITEPNEGKDFYNNNKNYIQCCKACAPGRYGNSRALNDSDEIDQRLEMGLKKKDIKNIFVHDFIGNSPFDKYNLIPDENNEIKIKCDLSNFNFLHLILIDDNCFMEEYLNLNKILNNENLKEIKKRDLRMINNLNFEKNYCELRKINFIKKNINYKINDLNSIKFKIFDSIEMYLNYLKLVCPNLNSEIQNFEFLINFENLNLKEKLEKISEYFSHELNIFIYFKFPNIFNEFIYPIIKYKYEKTFIDYFLLNDKSNLIKYQQPENLKNLNIFEKCLLIYSLKNENPEFCKNLARQIRTEVPKENNEKLKNLFNIALNLKSIQQEEMLDKIDEIEKPAIKKFGFGKEKKIKMKKKMEENTANMKFMKFAVINENLYKNVGKTKEYCETHYYNQIYNKENNKNLISSNHFFADLAQFWTDKNSDKNLNFNTENILIRPNNLTEILFILATIDLPLKSSKNNFKLTNENKSLTIENKENIYILTKEVSEAKIKQNNKNNLIIGELFYEFEDFNSLKEGKEVLNQTFLKNKKYLQKTIVTNISNKPINCEVLMFLPEGSIPILSEEYNIIENCHVNKFKSVLFTQYFYFPKEGEFKEYPPSASIDDYVISKSKIVNLKVVDKIVSDKKVFESFNNVLENGNKKDILNYFENEKDEYDENNKLKTKVLKENLHKILWLLKDKNFYMSLIQILKKKLFFYPEVFQFSIMHNDLETMKEYIEKTNNKQIFKKIGKKFDLLNLDETNNAHIFNHKDYYPILNSRIFKLPKAKNTILTKELRETYYKFISYLITLNEIDTKDLMRFCYYLILQQRIEEANIIFNRIDKTKISDIQIQYDYITAYLDLSFSYPNFDKARKIIKKYDGNFPIKNWNDMFNEIKDKLNEFDGKLNIDDNLIENNNEIKDFYDSTKLNKEKAKKEENLDFEIKDNKLHILFKNINQIQVKFYLIDIEILFSRSPFMKKTNVDFSFVKPYLTDTIKINNELKETFIDYNIPEDLMKKNIYIEISSNNIKKYLTNYSSILKCVIIESIGEIKILSPDLKPLPKVYIKSFCETKDNRIMFYKDGFTDLNGKFDYVSLNSDLINNVKKFSILINSDKFGTMIKQCNPPKMISERNYNQNMGGYEMFQNYRQEIRDRLRNTKQNII